MEPVPEMSTTMREGASGCVTVRPYLYEEVSIVTTAREPIPTMPERLRLLCHLFAASMVLTWIVNSLPYPARFGVIATGAAAVILASLALWATSGMERPLLMRMLLAVAGGVAMLTTLSTAVTLVIADELIAQSQCEQRALTSLALERCYDEFWDSIEARLPITRPE